jgi:hypothetical protein
MSQQGRHPAARARVSAVNFGVDGPDGSTGFFCPVALDIVAIVGNIEKLVGVQVMSKVQAGFMLPMR